MVSEDLNYGCSSFALSADSGNVWCRPTVGFCKLLSDSALPRGGVGRRGPFVESADRVFV